jgi:hypothetical protein
VGRIGVEGCAVANPFKGCKLGVCYLGVSGSASAPAIQSLELYVVVRTGAYQHVHQGLCLVQNLAARAPTIARKLAQTAPRTP